MARLVDAHLVVPCPPPGCLLLRLLLRLVWQPSVVADTSSCFPLTFYQFIMSVYMRMFAHCV